MIEVINKITIIMDRRLIVFTIIHFILNYVAAENPIVETSIGTIRGVRSDDGNIDMFMGIPYANVNESNPFGASLPHPGFDTVFDANDDSSICAQIEEFNYTLVGDVDCLFLNVYTPSTATPSSQLPVFVWIFGGGFTLGFYGRFMYGPSFLVRHDVILVTINYRLGPYGFMCLDIPEVPGNQGLKDTLTALRWVNKHIASFGGDPNKITLGGNSAGGIAADLHILRKPNGETLFNSVILHSGSALMLSSSESDPKSAVTMASYLGFETDDVYKAIEFLATIPPLQLIEMVETEGISTGPCVEKEFDGVEAFITENLSTAPYHIENVSIIVLITNDEGYSITLLGLDDPNLVSGFLGIAFDTEHEEFIGTKAVENFYFGDQVGDGAVRAIADLFGDIYFIYPSIRSLRKILEYNPKSLYFSMFAHDGGRNFVKYRENLTGGGAVHADELGYLFDMEFIPEVPTPEDQLVIDKLTMLWTNFMKYGDPTPAMTELLDVKWEPINATSPQNCMVIGTELSLVRSPFYDRVTFIDLLTEANEKLRRSRKTKTIRKPRQF